MLGVHNAITSTSPLIELDIQSRGAVLPGLGIPRREQSLQSTFVDSQAKTINEAISHYTRDETHFSQLNNSLAHLLT